MRKIRRFLNVFDKFLLFIGLLILLSIFVSLEYLFYTNGIVVGMLGTGVNLLVARIIIETYLEGRGI